MRQSANQVPAHWSKDFVEHLRTVHFTLIAISAGLILLVLSVREYDAAKALVQIEEIIDLKNQWSLLWIESHGTHDIYRYPSYGQDLRDIDVSSSPLFLVVTATGGPQVQTVSRCDWPKNNWSAIGLSVEIFPRTLKEFREWWLKLVTPAIVDIPRSAERSTEFVGFSAELSYSLPHGQHERGNVDMFLMRGTNNLYYEISSERLNEGFPLGLDVHSVERYVVSQKTIISTFTGLVPGNMQQTFPDLSIAASTAMDLPLEDVRDFIRDAAVKGQEVFEAFGMKFPAGRVTLWGEILVLSVQLYFFTYLRQLSGKLRADDPGWDVPWIGMDTARLSQVILFVSLVALPIGAIAVLGGQASLIWRQAVLPDDWRYRLLYRSEPVALFLALIASICLGILSWRCRPKVEAEEPSYSSPLFY
jgi:hypothetical protein